MKQIFSFLLFFHLLIAAGCRHGDEPAPPPTAEDGRTVLVYMAANNNLGASELDLRDIEEMEQGVAAWPSSALFNRAGRWLVFRSSAEGTQQLLELTPTGTKVLKDYDATVRAVEEERMRSVLADVRRIAPNKSYGVVLWSHGSGWLEDGISRQGAPERSFGSEGGRTMNNTTLARILEDFGHLDFIYFDCCFMASVESVYQLRHCAPWIVGSATEIPAEGMPYQENVAHLLALPSAGLPEAASNTFAYYNTQSGRARTCTMSVVYTPALDALAAATARIYDNSTYGVPAGYTPQRFEDRSAESCYYFDLADYVGALCVDDAGNERYAGANSDMQAFRAAMAEAVVYSAATPRLWDKIPLDRHNGLSTYILRTPNSSQVKNYCTLEWFERVASHLN